MATFQIEYNGITLNRDASYRIYDISGLFNVDLRHSIDDLTNGNAGNVWASNESMRRIAWSGIVFHETDQGFFNAVKELTSAFKKTNTALPLTVTLWNGDSKTLYAKVLTTPEVILDNQKKNAAYYRLSLICEDPDYFGNVENSDSVGLLTGGGGAIPTVVPMSLASGTGGQVTVNYTGNTTYPRITILGPATNSVVENRTTNKLFQINTNILTGETVTIQNTTAGISVTSDINGNYQSFFVGDLFQLVDGPNDIRFSASAYDPSALMTIFWSERASTPIS